MKKIRVLLICGVGASSGFMAANIRKEAKKQNIEMNIMARGEAEAENYLDEVDCLMIGPHLAYMLDEVMGLVEGKEIKVGLLDPKYYATLDGKKGLDHILEIMEEREESK